MIATTVQEGLLDAEKDDSFPLLALYEAYTDRWLTRDVGRARLSVEQRRVFSESLAEAFLWSGRESADWPHIRATLQKLPSWGDSPLTEEEAQVDIRNSGFLVRDLDDRFRFIHRSLMEFLAARAEIGHLRADKKPRAMPTDGFRLFLTQLIAKDWIEHQSPCFGGKTWAQNRGISVV
jgi:hypothetical protein